jgi:hypothetical protein
MGATSETSHEPEEWWDTDEVGSVSLSEESHSLKLPVSSIIMIDTEDDFVSLIDHGFNRVTEVGIDSEWKPVLNGAKSELALLQIAIRDRIFLLDMISLSKFQNHWQEMGITLFANEEIIKLGIYYFFFKVYLFNFNEND